MTVSSQEGTSPADTLIRYSQRSGCMYRGRFFLGWAVKPITKPVDRLNELGTRGILLDGLSNSINRRIYEFRLNKSLPESSHFQQLLPAKCTARVVGQVVEEPKFAGIQPFLHATNC